MNYKEFLKTKELKSIEAGFDVDKARLNQHLKPFQRDIVQWALRKGKAAIFSDCGTGKTIMQLEFANQICAHTGGRVLIVAPLAVVKQSRQEGEKFGIDVHICRTGDSVSDGINITNYEMLGHFNPDAFVGVILDESSILKSFTAATCHQLIVMFSRTPYRLCCTATPSPNDHSEMGNTAEFLGIMTRSEMLATYFIHDSGDTAKWRLKGHGEKMFWEWVATWAVCVRNPEDIGYSAAGYELPPLNLIEHICESEPDEYEMFAHRAETLSERRAARKESMGDRVQVAKGLVESSEDCWIVWCDYNAESNALHAEIGESVEVMGSDSPDYKADKAMDFAAGKIKALVSKPSIYGFGMNWQNCHEMIFCGISDSYELFYQAIRRVWRYGQSEPVNVHIIISEKEMNVLDNIKRKQAQMDEMQNNMISLMHEVTMSEIKKTARITESYEPKERMEIPEWIA